MGQVNRVPPIWHNVVCWVMAEMGAIWERNGSEMGHRFFRAQKHHTSCCRFFSAHFNEVFR